VLELGLRRLVSLPAHRTAGVVAALVIVRLVSVVAGQAAADPLPRKGQLGVVVQLRG